ncbi:MAG: L-threonylcarbamoyladenylate synthase [Clostridiales bacterium]|nr:L-threonylcarbamoyladenylate synthase [Clostridiales bacterium]
MAYNHFMKTTVIDIDPENINEDAIRKAAVLIRKGEVVAFPTETVYGLGANALDASAVHRIFEAKGRPSDNPLIVHICDISMLEEVAEHVPSKAHLLMERFWPGPLTIIMKKHKKIPYEVTAGLDTVGVRMPDHPIALALIRSAGVPIAAPSANISGRPSPTKPEHVIADMQGRIAAIIAGGTCKVGMESTVLDLSGDNPVLYRPGGITLEMIEGVIGKVDTAPGILKPVFAEGAVPSPGMKYKHYSPKARVIIVDGPIDRVIARIKKEADAYRQRGYNVGIMATEQTKAMYSEYMVIAVGDREKPETIAAALFDTLRLFDKAKADVVLAEAVDTNGVGLAIMNRMVRAAGFDIIHA